MPRRCGRILAAVLCPVLLPLSSDAEQPAPDNNGGAGLLRAAQLQGNSPFVGSGTSQGNPTTKELEKRWVDLRSESATTAYRAISWLSKYPKETPAFLYGNMRVITQVTAAEIETLIADLDADNFRRRTNASQQLKTLWRIAEPKLREALKQQRTLEWTRRAQEILRALEPELIRDIRAVEVLERIKNNAAQEVLKKLAKEWPGTRLHIEVQSSLQRLQTISQAQTSRASSSENVKED